MSSAAKRAARNQELTLLPKTKTNHNTQDNHRVIDAEVIPSTQGQRDTNAKAKHEATRPLTNTKHEAYCQHVVSGASHTAAYRAAFQPPVTKRDSDIRSLASKLHSKPEIQQRISAIAEEKARLMREELHDATKLRTFVLNGLAREAEQGDTSSARIRAMELLGKTTEVGMFTERSETTVSVKRSEDEVKAELIQRLSRLPKGSLE